MEPEHAIPQEIKRDPEETPTPNRRLVRYAFKELSRTLKPLETESPHALNFWVLVRRLTAGDDLPGTYFPHGRGPASRRTLNDCGDGDFFVHAENLCLRTRSAGPDTDPWSDLIILAVLDPALLEGVDDGDDSPGDRASPHDQPEAEGAVAAGPYKVAGLRRLGLIAIAPCLILGLHGSDRPGSNARHSHLDKVAASLAANGDPTPWLSQVRALETDCLALTLYEESVPDANNPGVGRARAALATNTSACARILATPALRSAGSSQGYCLRAACSSAPAPRVRRAEWRRVWSDAKRQVEQRTPPEQKALVAQYTPVLLPQGRASGLSELARVGDHVFLGQLGDANAARVVVGQSRNPSDPPIGFAFAVQMVSRAPLHAASTFGNHVPND